MRALHLDGLAGFYTRDACEKLEDRGCRTTSRVLGQLARGLYELPAALGPAPEAKGSQRQKARTGDPWPAKETASRAPGSGPWLGPLEYRIVSYVFNSGLRYFAPSELSRALGVDARRVHDALKRLEARGLARKVAAARRLL